MSASYKTAAKFKHNYPMVFILFDDPYSQQLLKKSKSVQGISEVKPRTNIQQDVDMYLGQKRDTYVEFDNKIFESIEEPEFHLVQEFEGFVEEVLDTTFLVVLKDVAVDEDLEPEDIGEFDLSLLSESDRKRLGVGAEIRWQVGYTLDSNENKEPVFNLTLCPPQTFTKDEHLDALAEAERIHNGLKKNEAS